MSGNDIIVDTNILSFLFENEQEIFKILVDKRIHISFITK
jgi:predicted nucleic acid-binding protein